MGKKVEKKLRKVIDKSAKSSRAAGLTPDKDKLKTARKRATQIGKGVDKTVNVGKKTAKGVIGTTGAVVGYDAMKETKSPRQMLDPKKDVMVVKNNKVIVIDKSKEAEYLKKGWGLAEQVDEAVKLGKGPTGSRLKFGKRLEVGDTVYCISNGEEGTITKIIGKHDRDSGTFEGKLKKSGKVMKKSLGQLSHDDKMDDVYEEVSPVMSPTQELNEFKKAYDAVKTGVKKVKTGVKKIDNVIVKGAEKFNQGDRYASYKKAAEHEKE